MQAHYDRLDREQQQLASGVGVAVRSVAAAAAAGQPVGVERADPRRLGSGRRRRRACGAAAVLGPVEQFQPGAAGRRAAPARSGTRGCRGWDYRLYSPPLFELSGDCTAVRSTAPVPVGDGGGAGGAGAAQSTIPPKLQLHITGTRGRKVDFAIRLNLMALLVPEDARRRMDYIRCVGEDELVLRGGSKPDLRPHVGDGGVDEWCRRFVEDPAAVKVFVLERQVVNADLAWLEGQVRSLVATTDYRGVVAVSFPVTHARVVVQSPDRVNRFFTQRPPPSSPARAPTRSSRPCGPSPPTAPASPAAASPSRARTPGGASGATPIKYAIATKRKGWSPTRTNSRP